MRRILVTGALGQIGSQLVPELCLRFGDERIVVSDVRMRHASADNDAGHHEHLDCTDSSELDRVIQRWDIGVIYHLGALLSAVAEEKPQLAWRVNMDGLVNILEAARRYQCKVFFPSSIGAFGPGTPRMGTPQVTVQRPTSMYGVTKVAGELLCDYYFRRFSVDTRGLRLPGLISANAMPGGGTTDYAVHIFHDAVRRGHYTCFLKPDTRLDMMYMPDAIRAMIELMQADSNHLKNRNGYNLAAMSITPQELAHAIQVYLPAFKVDYQIDPVRQAIADSWPDSVDDSAARTEWGWRAGYTLDPMVQQMLEHIQQQNHAPLRLAMY